MDQVEEVSKFTPSARELEQAELDMEKSRRAFRENAEVGIERKVNSLMGSVMLQAQIAGEYYMELKALENDGHRIFTDEQVLEIVKATLSLLPIHR